MASSDIAAWKVYNGKFNKEEMMRHLEEVDQENRKLRLELAQLRTLINSSKVSRETESNPLLVGSNKNQSVAFNTSSFPAKDPISNRVEEKKSHTISGAQFEDTVCASAELNLGHTLETKILPEADSGGTESKARGGEGFSSFANATDAADTKLISRAASARTSRRSSKVLSGRALLPPLVPTKSRMNRGFTFRYNSGANGVDLWNPPVGDISKWKVLKDDATMRDILNSADGKKYFKKFLERERSGENLQFLDEVSSVINGTKLEMEKMLTRAYRVYNTLVMTGLNNSPEDLLNKLGHSIKNHDLAEIHRSTLQVIKQLEQNILGPSNEKSFFSSEECQAASRCLSLRHFEKFPVLLVVYRISGCEMGKNWQCKFTLKGHNKEPKSEKTSLCKGKCKHPEWNETIRFENARYQDHVSVTFFKNRLVGGVQGYGRIELCQLKNAPIQHYKVKLYKSKALFRETDFSLHISILLDPSLLEN